MIVQLFGRYPIELVPSPLDLLEDIVRGFRPDVWSGIDVMYIDIFVNC